MLVGAEGVSAGRGTTGLIARPIMSSTPVTFSLIIRPPRGEVCGALTADSDPARAVRLK
jgi:hypothetical protein